MKKVLLTLICIMGTLFAAQAAPMNIINLTNCTCTFSFRGLGNPNLPSSYFETTNIIVPPGNTLYAGPNALPGYSSLPAAAIFKQIKGGLVSPSAGTGLACGTPDWGPTTMTTSVGVPCNNNFTVTATWQQNATGNIVVLIM